LPSLKTVTLSANRNISSKRWEIKIIDTPLSRRFSVIRYNSSHSRLESGAVGSSIIIIFALVESAFAISTSCC
jgi:hypothetical protein